MRRDEMTGAEKRSEENGVEEERVSCRSRTRKDADVDKELMTDRIGLDRWEGDDCDEMR